jgi:protein phosphatase
MTVNPPAASSAEQPLYGTDVDAFGLTDTGRVRSTNADSFLIMRLSRTMEVQGTNLPLESAQAGPGGYLFLVADGVGTGRGGEMASEKAAQSLANYVSRCANVYFAQRDHDDEKCVAELLQGVRQVHDEVRTEAEKGGRPGAATTMTLVVVFWPKAYLVHVGDSRAYRLRDDRLELLSHDQTVAQALIDAGALTASKGEMSPLKHILTSAIGADEATPEVQVVTARFEDVLLLCTDGLTKHVTEAEIEAILRERQPAEPTVRRLVNLALERGGSDNVTVVLAKPQSR